MNPSVRFIVCAILVTLLTAQATEDGRQHKYKPANTTNTRKNRKFPDHFSFGVATAAYQIEGGWDADGKGPSIWDTYTHEHPERIDDHSNGDVAADSYHLFYKDLEILKELKVNNYRFSISWPRVLPNGDISSRNQRGINYYHMMIDMLLASGIEPVITMYHWDMPAELQKIGGFTNPKMIEYFRAYADLLFREYGGKVKKWVTFNEPYEYCEHGWGNGNWPPMVRSPGVGDYMCMDTTVKAHAVVYRMYREKYYESQRGKVGITLSSLFVFSPSNDATAVDRAMQFMLGWLGHPIYSAEGDYSRVMLEAVAKNSKEEGRAWSRLESLEGEWKDFIKGSADFLGLNHYTSRLVESSPYPYGEVPSVERDQSVNYFLDSKWKRAKSEWLFSAPEGLEGILKWIRDNYNNVEVIVTENGWSDDGQLDDWERIEYLQGYLQAVLNAVNDGCNVSGYTYWSLIDNFEWQRGYTEKFGLYSVNRDSPGKERTAKKSAYYYRDIIERRGL